MLAHLALLGRIALLGYERIAVKKLGTGEDPTASTFLFFAIGAIFLLPFAFLAPWPPSSDFFLYAAASSLVYALAFWLYVRSLSEGEASLVSPLYNFNLFFLLILAFIFLGESLSPFKIAGMLLLFYGASFLNKKGSALSSLRSLFTIRACLLMLASSFFIAIGRVIDGFVVKSADPLAYSFFIYSGISLVLLIALAAKGKLKKAAGLAKRKPKWAIISSAVNAYSYLCLLVAFTAIEVSVAEPASMLGMAVTVILAGHEFKEKIKERLVGVLIMALGAWLLFL